MKSGRLSFVVGLLTLAWTSIGSAVAQPAAPVASEKIPAAAIEAPTFHAYVDGVVQAQMQSLAIPGMAVAIVTPDAAYLKDYGVGARDGMPVALSTDETLVPLASVSKAFIGVTLMRLVERGSIELDAPASRYLDFPLPRFPGAREITVRDLACHEAGFEERWLSIGAGRKADPRTFAEIVAQTAPNVIAPPGAYQSYSNYGSALVAYIVQRVAGASYDRVLQKEVLDPLGMTSTTIEAPGRELLTPFEPRIVAGWKVSGGVVRADEAFVNVRTYPAGRMLSTPGDMTRFMRMILADGAMPNGQRFLSSQSVDLLLKPHRRVHPSMTSVGVFFAEKDINGHRFVGHGGDGGAHHVDMVISPDLGVAMFVDVLSAPGPQTRDFFTRSILSALTKPAPTASEAASPDTRALKRYAGDYRHYRWAFTTVEKMLQLTSQFSVKATGKGTLVVTGRLGPGEYAPVDQAGLFRNVMTGELLFIGAGYRGRMTLNHGTFPFVTAYKLEPWETQAFNGLAFWVFVGGLTGLGVIGLITAVRAVLKASVGAAIGFSSLAFALLACGIGFFSFVTIAQGLSELDVQGGAPAIANVLLAIPVVSAVIAVGFTLAAFAGPARPRTFAGGAYAFIALAALAAFFAYLSFWNGFGWHMPR